MGGLYPAFVSWCKDGGVMPVSKIRFVDDVLRVVEVGDVVDRRPNDAGGKRRKVKYIAGLRLLPE
jgi:phage/plasmid-associated DNA primase